MLRLNIKFNKIFIFIFIVFVLSGTIAFANKVTELKNKIQDSQDEIQKIEAEIRKYEEELKKVSHKKKTLKNALYSIELSRKKLINQITLTEDKIDKLEQDIQKLKNGVENKEKKIKKNKKLLAQVLRIANEYESRSLAEILFSSNFSKMLNEIENINKIQQLIQDNNRKLAVKKQELQNGLEKLAQAKSDLLKAKSKLQTQKQSVDVARKEQKRLVNATQNKEANYQKILAAKRQAKREFEEQMLEYEAKLKYILDPNSIPKIGSKVFRWPVDNVWITQYFGNTKFAKSGAYNGKGHNGIDLGVSIGTPVKAVLSGIVVETGNTDAYPGCYSYGKWVLIKHGNGLASLYAHLSKINVSNGQKIKTGQVIAYSGNTGYSTGPHLHFTVYAADAVRVVPLGKWRKTHYCAKARVPVAPLRAYMNPIDFLK